MNSIEIAVLGIVVGTSLAVITVLIWNRLTESMRVRGVRRWVTRYVCMHYGGVEDLTIHCSSNQRLPIGAGFDIASTGIRHLLSFTTHVGGAIPCSFLSETRESIGLRTPKLSPAVIAKATIGKLRPSPRGFLRVYCRENAGSVRRPAV